MAAKGEMMMDDTVDSGPSGNAAISPPSGTVAPIWRGLTGHHIVSLPFGVLAAAQNEFYDGHRVWSRTNIRCGEIPPPSFFAFDQRWIRWAALHSQLSGGLVTLPREEPHPQWPCFVQPSPAYPAPMPLA